MQDRMVGTLVAPDKCAHERCEDRQIEFALVVHHGTEPRGQPRLRHERIRCPHEETSDPVRRIPKDSITNLEILAHCSSSRPGAGVSLLRGSVMPFMESKRLPDGLGSPNASALGLPSPRRLDWRYGRRSCRC